MVADDGLGADCVINDLYELGREPSVVDCLVVKVDVQRDIIPRAPNYFHSRHGRRRHPVANADSISMTRCCRQLRHHDAHVVAKRDVAELEDGPSVASSPSNALNALGSVEALTEPESPVLVIPTARQVRSPRSHGTYSAPGERGWSSGDMSWRMRSSQGRACRGRCVKVHE
jgi:hypothetical protein